MNGPSERRLSLWMALAMSSLPVPVSPINRTLAERGAASRTRRYTSCMTGAVPTISGNGGSIDSLRGIASSLPGEEARKPVHSEARQNEYSDWCPELPHEPPSNRAREGRGTNVTGQGRQGRQDRHTPKA